MCSAILLEGYKYVSSDRMDCPCRDYRVLQQIRYGQYRLAKLTGDLCLRSPQNLLQSFRGPRGGGASRANLNYTHTYHLYV